MNVILTNKTRTRFPSPAPCLRKSESGFSCRSGVSLVMVMLTVLMLVFSVSGCGSSSGGKKAASASGVPVSPNPRLPEVELVSGSIRLIAEVADSEEERTRGLMYRKELADGKGMLFVFDRDERPAFWMKNTTIPLSIAYIASDGTITDILDLVPLSEEPRASSRSVRYALEVPSGWFSRVGLKPGDRFDVPLFR